MEKTVGIAELTSITYGIAASDAMLKAGQVRMLRSAPMCPGKYLIVIGGDTGEVKAAMEAGAELAGKHLRNFMSSRIFMSRYWMRFLKNQRWSQGKQLVYWRAP